jgi:hypothetical protein
MSKKRSDTSTPPEPLTIYLDENINRGIAEELRAYNREWRVEVHRDHFPHDPQGRDVSIPDTEVLKKCGENGWLLISLDDSMRRVPQNVEAAVAYRTKVFLFSNGNRKGGEYKAALIVGRFKLLKYARKQDGPFFARLSMDGTPTPLEPDLTAAQVREATNDEAERV